MNLICFDSGDTMEVLTVTSSSLLGRYDNMIVKASSTLLLLPR